jgi:signal transduction histidine kinase
VLLPLRTVNGVDGLLTLVWAEDNAQSFYDVDVELPATFAEQTALALQVANAQEAQARLAVFEDRDRIGRDLHDLVIQRLFAIGLSLESTSKLVSRPDAPARIGAAVDDIDATIKDIRRSIFALSVPAESRDLRSELLNIVTASRSGLGFEPRFLTSGALDLAVPVSIRPHLLAVVTEALSNAARHAEATSVTVDLTVGDDIVLTVSDDGVGFDLDAGERRSGLRNMRDRAESLGGSCDLASEPGRGTAITWRVPRSGTAA